MSKIAETSEFEITPPMRLAFECGLWSIIGTLIVRFTPLYKIFDFVKSIWFLPIIQVLCGLGIIQALFVPNMNTKLQIFVLLIWALWLISYLVMAIMAFAKKQKTSKKIYSINTLSYIVFAIGTCIVAFFVRDRGGTYNSRKMNSSMKGEKSDLHLESDLRESLRGNKTPKVPGQKSSRTSLYTPNAPDEESMESHQIEGATTGDYVYQ